MASYELPLDRLASKLAEIPEETWLHEQIDGEWVALTCEQVIDRARRIGAAMLANGLEPGDRVSILAKNSPQWMITDFACMMAGLISVPIYTTAGESTLSYVLEHSGAKLMCLGKVDNSTAAEITLANIPVLAFPDCNSDASIVNHRWEDWLEQEPLAEIAAPKEDDIATLVYTSGSTGNPKGVVLSFKNLASAAFSVVDAWQDEDEDAPQDFRVMSYLPMAHITERSVVSMASLYHHGDIFFSGGLDTFIDDLRHARPTNFVSVPRLWSKFQAQVLAVIPDDQLQVMLASDDGEAVAAGIREQLGLNHARQFGSGSAPISQGLLEWFSGIGIDIAEGWGMSETSGASCSNMPFERALLGTIGRPLSCVEMSLSDEGEILIRGDAVFGEYYKNPEATNEAFIDGWFRTGDKATVNEDGSWSIIGRVKEQFKTAKGKYVAPVPIESLLSALHYVEQAAVLGLGRAQPMAILVANFTDDSDRDALSAQISADMDSINAGLEPHCRLNNILVSKEPFAIENGLLTPTLKLKRDMIEKHYAAHLGDEFGGVNWE